MPTTVDELVWYMMCFIVTTGLPTVIVIALNIQKLLQDVLVKQATQAQWIENHDKSSEANLRDLWKAIDELRAKYEVFVYGLRKRDEEEG